MVPECNDFRVDLMDWLKTMTTLTPSQTIDTVERHFQHRGFGVEFEMEVDWIRAHVPADAARIVEIGCGIGSLFPVLGERRVIGVDYSREGLELTARRYPDVPLLCASAEALPLADCFADVIVAQHVIEHLHGYRVALREWFRVLKCDGTLLVLTPNAAFIDPGVFNDETHVHIFTMDKLGDAMTNAGFVIDDLRTLGLPLFRDYRRVVAGWRMRRWITEQAGMLSRIPGLRRRGQTLCCAAIKPR